MLFFDNLLKSSYLGNKYIQTQYFIEQFYMKLGEFEDILETFFKAG